MPEEEVVKTDQAVEKTTQEQSTVEPGKATEAKAPELPKEGFFQEGRMAKYASEMEMFADEKAAPAVEKKEDCIDCGDKKTKQEPIAVLTVDGKEVPVYTQKELNDYAQKGYHYTQGRQKTKEREGDLDARESAISRVEKPLTDLVDFLKRPQGTEEALPPKEEDDLEFVDDAVKKRFQTYEDKIQSLTSTVEQLSQRGAKQDAVVITSQLDETFKKVREEHPYEDIVDAEGKNLTKTLYAARVATEANEDYKKVKADPSFKARSLPEIMAATAKEFHVLEQSHKQKFGGSDNGKAPTAQYLAESHPEVVKDIGEAAILQYLQKKEAGEDPVIVPAKPDSTSAEPGRKKEMGLKESLKAALDDPEISDAINEAGKGTGGQRNYGLRK